MITVIIEVCRYLVGDHWQRQWDRKKKQQRNNGQLFDMIRAKGRQ